MKSKMTLLVAPLLTLALTSAAAYADTVSFTLTNPTQYVSVTRGGSLTYDATVSAPASNSAAIFLNGDSFNVTAPVSLNDSDFFSGFPLSLMPGTSFTGDLFVLTLPAGSSAQAYLGSFTLLGGANGNASSTLGTVNFTLAPTPEPSSLLLLATGIAGLAWFVSRRGSASQSLG